MKKLIIYTAAVIVISMTGCKNPTAPPSGVSHAVPQNPNELTEADVLTAFGLQRGSITASAAAKKIANGTPSGGITFTERTAVSYDDQAGTFTVKVKGTKNGKPFDKILSLTGFTHPLKDKMIQSIVACELNLDDAIEHNYSLGKYIAEVNKDPSGKKLVKKLSFMLSDSVTTIELGEHDSYTLTAKAKKSDTKILVQPSVKIVFRKLLNEGGTETLTNSMPFGFTHLKAQLIKDYFVASDVFQYILNETADTAIKVEPTEFASSFYAAAKSTGQAPVNLFTDAFKTKMQDYHGRYHSNPDGHLALDISYGAVQPKTGGIDADDYTGTVTVDLCIATNQQIADQSDITAIKQIKKSGFACIPNSTALAAKTHLFFHLIPKILLTAALKTQWEQKNFSNHPLFRVDESTGAAAINNPFTATNNPFNLSVNGSGNNLSSHLGCAIFSASKTRHNKVILIENIQLQKAANSKFMIVQVKLKGSGGILEVPADPGY